MSSKEVVIDELDFFTNEFMTEVKGDDPVSSSMFDKIFIMGNRIPKELISDIISSPEKVEQMMLANAPIYKTHIEKPYWKNADRGFTRLNVDIFGSICLADDRHLLDIIISHGSMIKDASKYTLRQVAEGLGLKEVVWDWVKQDAIDRPMLNRGIYFHVSFNELCIGMGLQPKKVNRLKILERLRRLSIMHLSITPVLNDNVMNEKSFALSLIDREFYSLLDVSKVHNGIFNDETQTDLIVNISELYIMSLTKDGIISRKRLKNNYLYLTGKNSIQDVYKYLDSHRRTYLHGKLLGDLLDGYFENKMTTFGINIRHKKIQLFEQIVADKKKLLDHFNIILKEESDGRDYVLLYTESLKDSLIKRG